jgi:Arc/MetJ-type ribon-helix-helix transcriptional regulator
VEAVVTITLSPEIQKRIDRSLESGEFESAEAIVEQALALFLEPLDEAELAEARDAIGQARRQAERGEGTALEDFDRHMRSK